MTFLLVLAAVLLFAAIMGCLFLIIHLVFQLIEEWCSRYESIKDKAINIAYILILFIVISGAITGLVQILPEEKCCEIAIPAK